MLHDGRGKPNLGCEVQARQIPKLKGVSQIELEYAMWKNLHGKDQEAKKGI